jgi:hypothetical protein
MRRVHFLVNRWPVNFRAELDFHRAITHIVTKH